MADVGRSEGKWNRATLDEIGQEKQRVSERLARLDTERARLADQLGELEIAERVLTRSGRAVRTKRRRRGGLATPAPATGGEWSARGARLIYGGQSSVLPDPPDIGGQGQRVFEPSMTARKEAETAMSFFITKAQKAALRRLGYSEEQIREMKPEDAHRALGLIS
jgi:hypothetical protein